MADQIDTRGKKGGIKIVKTEPAPPVEAEEEPIFPIPLPRSLKGRFLSALLAVSLLSLIAVLFVIYAMWRIEDKVRIIESFYEINQQILEVRRYEKNYILYGNEEDLLHALDYLDQVRAAMARVGLALPEHGPELRSLYDVDLVRYEEILKRLTAQGVSAKQRRLLQAQLRRLGQEITSRVFDMDTRARLQVEKEVKGYQRAAIILLGGAVLLGGLLISFLLRWIMRPLQAIRDACAQVRQGEMRYIPLSDTIRASVEGVELAKSLNLMLEALVAKQEQLVQSEKLAAIGRVTAGIAHEINNPLNNISLTAEVLLEDLPNLDCSERLDMVRDILVQSDRARKVVHHLLEFSRPHKSDRRGRVELCDLVQDTVLLVKNQFRLASVTHEVRCPPEQLQVNGNRDQLQQVLVNIILNAVQVMEPGGKLTITLAGENGQAVMEITDTGPGIPEDVLPHIFDPFFTTKSDGTGLGLSLSYSIIKDHRGEISVTSRKGEGTTFRIVLPLSQGE